MGAFTGWSAVPKHMLLQQLFKNVLPIFTIRNEYEDEYRMIECIFAAGDTKPYFPSTVCIYRNTRKRRIELEKDGIVHDIGDVIAVKTIVYKEQQGELAAIQLAADLPGIVPAACLYVGEQRPCDTPEAYSCIVMPYVPTTLHRAIRTADHYQCLTLLRDVAKMVYSMYVSGLCYVDLKMTNIVITKDAQLLFIDYGSLGEIGTCEAYATYPPVESPTGVLVECSESTMVEIFGSFLLTMLYPECEPNLRFTTEDLVKGRKNALKWVTCKLCRDVVKFCWMKGPKSLYDLVLLIDAAVCIHMGPIATLKVP